MGASAYDYNEAVVDFETGTGRASRSFFTQFCGGPDNCFGGLDQADNAFFNRLDLVESEIGTNGNRVQIVNAAALSATTQDGSNDQGWDGTTETPDVVVTFTGVAEGTTEIVVGTGYQGDGVVVPGGSVVQATGDSITITVPEPGAVAASVGALGTLLGVIGIRRRA